MAGAKGTDDITNAFRQMTVGADDINVLLLGETGIGKSTFINSFTNYMHYKSFDVAEKADVKCLIPAKFEVTDESDGRFVKKTISIGEDLNENTSIVSAATQSARSYVFPLPDYNSRKLRLIDTPGICDNRGIEQDESNLENILSYIGKIERLHAICILLKPNNARLTVAFQYCITQLLSRLEKSAGNNIVFVFTHSRSTFYKPGDTSAAIVRILDLITQNPPHVKIRFEKENVFCLDNESFRYLAALKQNVNLSSKSSFIDSWEHSVKECHRLIKYIIGEGTTKIEPHQVNKTISVNKVRQVITELSKPLADITETIDSNVHVLQKHQKTLQIDILSIETLKSQLNKVEGFGIKAQIADREAAVEETKRTIRDIEKRKNELEGEKKIIVRAITKFAHFLECNAISPFNDSYKTYIEYLIKRESSRGPEYCVQTVQRLEGLLKQYDEEKKIRVDALKTSTVVQNITPDMILQQIQELYALPNIGQMIRNLHNLQKRGEAFAHKNTEFVLPKCDPHDSDSFAGKGNRGKNKGKGGNQKGKGKMNVVHEENKFKNNKKGGPQNQFGKEKFQNEKFKREFQNNLPNYQSPGYQTNPQGNWKQNAGFPHHYQGNQNIQHPPPYYQNTFQGNSMHYQNPPQFNAGYNNPPPPYSMNYQNIPPLMNQYPSQWNQDPRQQSFPGYNPQYQPSQGSYEGHPRNPPQKNFRPQQQHRNKNYDKFGPNKPDAFKEHDEQPSQGSYERHQSVPQKNSRPQQQQQHNKNYDKFVTNKPDASKEHNEQPSQASYERHHSVPQKNSRPQQQRQHNEDYDKFATDKPDVSKEYDELYGNKKKYTKTKKETKDYCSKDTDNDNKRSTGFESSHKRKELNKQQVDSEDLYGDLDDNDKHDDTSSQTSEPFFSSMKNIFK